MIEECCDYANVKYKSKRTTISFFAASALYISLSRSRARWILPVNVNGFGLKDLVDYSESYSTHVFRYSLQLIFGIFYQTLQMNIQIKLSYQLKSWELLFSFILIYLTCILSGYHVWYLLINIHKALSHSVLNVKAAHCSASSKVKTVWPSLPSHYLTWTCYIRAALLRVPQCYVRLSHLARPLACMFSV